MATILAAGYATAYAIEALGQVLAPLGVSRRAIRAAYRLIQYSTAPPGPGGGPAGRAARASGPVLRAMYLVAAARRLTAGLAAGDRETALRRERRYLRAHLAAQRRRSAAARAADDAGEASRRAGAGVVFRWFYVSEPGTPCVPIGGRACRDLHGSVFPVASPPDGTWPGMRHYGCKCIPVQVAQVTLH